MGCRQGGGRLFNQALHAGAVGPGAGAAFGLDQVSADSHQFQGQQLLFVQGQGVGHGHREGYVGQQGPGAPGEFEHFLGAKYPAQGIEAVVVTDFHHGGAGRHRGGEQLRVHRRHTDGQP